MDVCVLFLFLTILYLGHCEKATITDDCTPLVLTPSSLLVKYGDSAKVNCSIQGKPEEQYILGWESKTSQPDTQTETSLMWNVNSLTNWEEHDGLKCYYTVGQDNQITCKLNLIIYKPPDSITLSSDVWTEGTETELRCEIVNVGPGRKLSVNWSREDPKQNNTFTVFSTTSFPDLVNYISSVNRTVKLNVTARREDEGLQYRCEAVLDLDPYGLKVLKSQPVNITVHYKPVIRQSSHQVHVYTGESLTIDCSADGNPTPVYDWTSPNNNIFSSPNSSSITISSVSTEHQGQYTCNATNSAGEATMNVTVTVTPIIIHIIIHIMIGVVIGVVLLVVLPCAVYRMCYRPTYMGQ